MDPHFRASEVLEIVPEARMNTIRVWRNRDILPPKKPGWKEYSFREIVIIACLFELKGLGVDIRTASKILHDANLEHEIEYVPNKNEDGAVIMGTANDCILATVTSGVGPERNTELIVFNEGEFRKRLQRTPKPSSLQYINISEIRRVIQIKINVTFDLENSEAGAKK